jgi:hypothetical protein
LANQGFDFNRFIYEGIPFMRAADRNRRLAAVDKEPCRSEIAIQTPEDVLFVQQLVEQVAQWLQVTAALL